MRHVSTMTLCLLLSACGNQERPRNGSANPPDIEGFELQAAESGFYGHWQRIEPDGSSKIDKYLSIDNRVVLHTTVCRYSAATNHATAVSKIELDDAGLMTVKSNDYAETYNEDSKVLCSSKLRAGDYQLSQSHESELFIKQPGLPKMEFRRVKKSAITD